MAITNIYKGALERSDIQKIYKGTTLLYEKVLPPQGKTWVINESPPAGAPTATIDFTSNNILFTSMTYIVKRPMEGKSEWYYGDTLVADGMAGDVLTFTDQAYRTITFDASPTGVLLAWLQANAVKQ